MTRKIVRATKVAKKIARVSRAVATTELSKALAEIHKHKGEAVVLSAKKIPQCNRIPTGAFTLDFGLLGGVPEGHAVMLYGLESSGKTYLAKRIVAEFHRKHPDKHAVWIDAEQLFDKDWAETLGCDLSRLQVARPDTGNEAVDLMDALMQPEEVGLIVLDSIAGCVPKAIADKSAEDHTMGELARLMGIMCSKILTNWSQERKRKHYVTVVLINQFRFKIGVMFGDNRTTPGGRQPNHLCSTKIEVKNLEERDKGKTDSFGNDIIARNVHNFKLTKTKHGVSIREGEFKVSIAPELNDDIPLGAMINHKTVTAYAKKMGVLTGGGSGGFKFAGIRPKFRIIDDAADYLLKNPDELTKIYRKLIMMQRIEKGLTPLPPDGYLMTWDEPEDDE
jgi:recombination protein RecA